MTYHLLSFFLKLVSRIPFCVLYALSDCLYYLIYYVVRYRRTVVRNNLLSSFPEKTEKEIKNIEKNFYRFFADNLLESCKLATISKEEVSRRMHFTNPDDVNAVMKQGKSISLFMGHYGNWEWCSSMPINFIDGVTSLQIYHQLRNENMNRVILDSRERMGAKGVEMRQTARYITERIREGKVCVTGFIADQSPKKKECKFFIPFLNHNVPVLVGIEKITKHYDFEAWFVRVKRIKRGYYEATYVRMHENPKALPDYELTAIYYRMLEEAIHDQPELYLWTHRRFKHAKPLTNSL